MSLLVPVVRFICTMDLYATRKTTITTNHGRFSIQNIGWDTGYWTNYRFSSLNKRSQLYRGRIPPSLRKVKFLVIYYTDSGIEACRKYWEIKTFSSLLLSTNYRHIYLMNKNHVTGVIIIYTRVHSWAFASSPILSITAMPTPWGQRGKKLYYKLMSYPQSQQSFS